MEYYYVTSLHTVLLLRKLNHLGSKVAFLYNQLCYGMCDRRVDQFTLVRQRSHTSARFSFFFTVPKLH